MSLYMTNETQMSFQFRFRFFFFEVKKKEELSFKERGSNFEASSFSLEKETQLKIEEPKRINLSPQNVKLLITSL